MPVRAIPFVLLTLLLFLLCLQAQAADTAIERFDVQGRMVSSSSGLKNERTPQVGLEAGFRRQVCHHVRVLIAPVEPSDGTGSGLDGHHSADIASEGWCGGRVQADACERHGGFEGVTAGSGRERIGSTQGGEISGSALQWLTANRRQSSMRWGFNHEPTADETWNTSRGQEAFGGVTATSSRMLTLSA
ncbi:MAG TPA: hypothetical protein VM186_00665 [Planctomycetota bacterium]|nr:hypothetical protein [Planctomycetota bacterium]